MHKVSRYLRAQLKKRQPEISQEQRDITNAIAHRWNVLFEQEFSDITDERERKFLKAILIEVGAGIPILTDPNLIEDIPLLKEIKEFIDKLLRDRDVDLLSLFEKVIKKIFKKEDIYIHRRYLLNLIPKIAYQEIFERGKYDFNEETQIEEYLQNFMLLMGKIKELINKSRSVYLTTGEDYEIADVWTEIVIIGALELSNIRVWDGKRYENILDKVKKGYSVCKLDDEDVTIRPSRVRIALDEIYSNLHPKIREPVIAYTTNWLSVIEKPDELRDIIEQLRQPTDLNVRRNLLKQAADIFNTLPDDVPFQDAERLGFISEPETSEPPPSTVKRIALIEDFIKATSLGPDDFETLDDVETFFGWIQLISRNAEEYSTLVNYNIEVLESNVGRYADIFETIVNLNSVRDGIVNLEYAEKIYDRRPILDRNKLKIDFHYPWVYAAFCLLVTVDIDRINDANRFFEILDSSLRRWDFSLVSEEYPLYWRAVELPIKKGISLLEGLNLAEDSPERLHKLFLLSFFIKDPTIQRLLQEYTLSRLVERLPFDKACNLIFYDYEPQGFLASVSILEKLDEKAETKEDFSLLREAWVDIRQRGLGVMGRYVIVEKVLEEILERIDELELLIALLGSGTDDTQLREVIGKAWWDFYKKIIMSSLSRKLLSVGTVEDVENICDEAPELISVKDKEYSEKDQASVDYISLESIIDKIYRLSPMERDILLRRLLVGRRGILKDPQKRKELLEKFFEYYLDESTEPALASTLKKIIGALSDAMSYDELYLQLQPLLLPRICVPPKKPNTDFYTKQAQGWVREYLEEEFDKRPSLSAYLYADIYGPADGLTEQEIENRKRKGKIMEECSQVIAKPIEWLLRGYRPGTTRELSEEEKLTRIIPEDIYRRDTNIFKPLELIREAATRLGAPGVRFLQLLAHTIELPETYREEFLRVFDSNKGQTKLSAWMTIEKELPEYAKRIKRFGERIGGGSLYTVYKVDVVATDDEYPGQAGQVKTEVVRVLNPNALYHARESIRIIRKALNELSKQDREYAQALPLVDLLETWVENELNDTSYEQNDRQFYSLWNRKSPNERLRAHIVIPRSIPTGTHRIRREEFVKGINLTQLGKGTLSGEGRKKVMALAGQHYIGQIFSGETGDSLVHSDFSPGNLALTEDENLAIYDRGMYLVFEQRDREFLMELITANNLNELVSYFVDWLFRLDENKEIVPSLKKEDVPQDLIVRLKDITDRQDILLKLRIAIAKYNLKMPLKFELLFKNLNVINQMCRQIGFSSMQEMLLYNRSLSELLKGAGDYIRRRSQDVGRNFRRGQRIISSSI